MAEVKILTLIDKDGEPIVPQTSMVAVSLAKGATTEANMIDL